MTSPSRSSAPRPEPVTKAGALAGIVAALLLLAGLIARTMGWISDDLDVTAVANRASDVVLGAGALWASLAPIALAFRARAKVTPLADPRDALGRILTTAEAAGPLIDDLYAYLDELRDHVTTSPGQHAAPAPSTSSSTPTPAPAVEDPATTALLGPSLYDQLAAEQAAAAAPQTALMPSALPAVPATVTSSPTAQPATPATTA